MLATSAIAIELQRTWPREDGPLPLAMHMPLWCVFQRMAATIAQATPPWATPELMNTLRATCRAKSSA